MVGAQLAQRQRWVAVLLPLAVLDVLLVCGMPHRTARLPWSSPSALAHLPAEGAALSLIPDLEGPTIHVYQLVNNLDCAYQADHGRPLLNYCLGTPRRLGPRWHTSAWLVEQVLAGGEPGDTRRGLADLGIGSVIWRPDLHGTADRTALDAGLRELLGPPVAESRDAGEHLLVFAVPDPAPAEEARRTWLLAR